MERPNRTEKRKSGTQVLTSSVSRSPKSSLPIPFWKTSTIRPYAAPTESRLRRIALNESTIERNAIVRRTKLRRSTNAMILGSQVSMSSV